MTELGEQMPVFRPPLDMTALYGEPRLGETGELGLTLRYLTPHSKWSIHSEYQDNLFMLSLSRGGQHIWMSDRDAAKIGIRDNDWIEAVNRNGVVVARAIVSHRMPEGTVYMHHAQDRLIDVPRAETVRQARWHPQLADAALPQTQPSDRRVRAADVRLQLPGPDGQPTRRGHRDPSALPGGRVLMKGAV